MLFPPPFRAILIFSTCLVATVAIGKKREGGGVEPPVWPEAFHAVLFQNRSGDLAMVDLYYDYANGRNLNLIQGMHDQDEGAPGNLWDVEYNNGSTYYYHPKSKDCKTIQMPVGILKPNWLDGADYLGTEDTDGYTCNVWTKSDGFIKYWEDVKSRRPVKWIFGSGMEEQVMKWTPNETLSDPHWQIPDFCFQNERLVDPDVELVEKTAFTVMRMIAWMLGAVY
ncbi:hypothetical protein AAMO2058_001281100 [Amorphochlora amoebiformis]